MTDSVDIEGKIREVVQLYNKSSKGWESCLHSCDHGRKGPRAAFNFSEDSISFHCFNCQITTGVQLHKSVSLPAKFRTVLEDFGLSKKDINQISFYLSSKNRHGSNAPDKIAQLESLIPEKIKLPSDFIMLEGNENTKLGKLAIAELQRRKIDHDSYPFMLCSTKNENRIEWNNRLVIPTFYKNDLVFYQAQDVTKKALAKYLNAYDRNIDRSKLISQYDFMHSYSNENLYVVEGWYDAYHINGVALYGNRIHENQHRLLNRTNRPKIYIPDRSGDGAKIAKKCLDYGWNISVPYAKLDPSVKDISDMITKYGKLFTLQRIEDSIATSKSMALVQLALLVK